MAAIMRKYSLTAKGIIGIDENGIFIENPDDGTMIYFEELFRDFDNKPVKISVGYDEEY